MPAVAVTGGTRGGVGQGRSARVGAPGGAGLAGQQSAILHELKVISCSRSRYKPGHTKKSVDMRAGLLQNEYLKKSRKADRRQGVLEGQVGRVESKLVSLGELRGLVVGNFGELSEDFHSLINAMATSRT